MGGVRIQVLGPVRVVRGEREVRIGGARERAVLASLVLDVNRVVSVDRLIEAIWGGHPPASARSQVAICVSRLRRALAEVGMDTVIGTASPGYLARLDPSAADWPTFTSLTARAAAKTAAGDQLAAVALLREALSLWRGTPFEDLPGMRLEADRLTQARLDAVEACADLELRIGRHDRVLADLAGVVAEHPLRERARARLMLAQYRSGRRAEALRTYAEARRVLAEQIGLDPGPELRDLHERILRDAPVLSPSPSAPAVAEMGATVPAQLPRQPVPFVGRIRELAFVDAALRAGPGAPGAVVLSGPREIGKTTLALCWAHAHRDEFQHGQLYAALRDERGEAVPPAVVLDRFLRAFGFAASAIPDDPHEKAALYRSSAAHRRLLVVLDDAVSDEQVLPLLPGCPASRVLVTSEAPLDDVVVRQGARRCPVDPLGPEDSRRLLVELLGSDLVEAKRHEVRHLVNGCRGVPLLLRRAAARLGSARPGAPVGLGVG